MARASGNTSTLSDQFRDDARLWLAVFIGCVFGIVLAMALCAIADEVIVGTRHSGQPFFFGDKAPIRNVLESASFFAGVSVAVIATIAAVITIRQLKEAENTRLAANRQIKEAENTRLAANYLAITADYFSSEISRSRREIALMRSRFKADGKEPIAKYFDMALRDLYQKHLTGQTSTNGISDYDKIMRFVWYLEAIGVLARKEYVRKQDIFDLFGAAMITTEQCLQQHIQWRRDMADHDKDAFLANALWLIDEAKKARKTGDLFRFNPGS